MKKDIKKTDNYFERNRITRQARNYRYNFVDYLYYQGERYSKKYPRSSGNMLITLYWIGFVFFPLLPFFAPHYTNILGDILVKINLMDNLHPILEVVIFLFPIFVAIALPPDLWCLLRYRKNRVAAIKHHYRQSIWKDAIPMWLLWMIPTLFDLLSLFVIYVTTKK
ncbi:hypothetical protein [uncultured Parabacteroides sp.]|uniref:hypothetical protein n=1 Tax=uncultured Parabacteroides sp. TaxID=512312 RepID=UPI002623AA4B|nr:hypothetical protein [uncultured Parabacteroides sp.]